MKQFKSVFTLLLVLVMILSCVSTVFAADCAHTNTEIRNAVAAGCETEGYSGDTYCADCGILLAKGAALPATGHHYDEGVISKPATCTEDGVRTYLCKDCGSTYTTVIKASGHIFGDWVVTTPATATMKGVESRVCSVCDAVETREIKPLGYAKCYARHYKDCPDKWYHEAIDFVVDQCLMNGMSTTIFAPSGTMTRAMIVTVLYRMAGEPKVTALSSFKDVERNKWYAEPISWAQDIGIVNGYSREKFGPNEPVSRQQIATFLWRFANEPESKGDGMSKFSDADKISTYAEDAMKWAVAEGILQGNKGKLMPTDKATRAQFACMLMRYYGGSYICESMKDWDDDEEPAVEGTYRLYNIDGKSIKNYLIDKLGDEKRAEAYLKSHGLSSYEDLLVLTLKTDGKASATYLGKNYSGTWKRSGDRVTLASDGDELEGTYKKGELTFVVDGEAWVLAK